MNGEQRDRLVCPLGGCTLEVCTATPDRGVEGPARTLRVMGRAVSVQVAREDVIEAARRLHHAVDARLAGQDYQDALEALKLALEILAAREALDGVEVTAVTPPRGWDDG